MQADSTTHTEADPLTRRRLSGLPRRSLRAGRNFTKAKIDLVEMDRQTIVVKDLARSPWPIRHLLGPWQLGREERAYRRLAGTPGIPKLIGRPDRQSIAIEYIQGRTLERYRRGQLDGTFFDRLRELVLAVHRKGIAHGDLHHRDVLVGPDGAPYLVDFATSLVADPDADPLRAFLFDQMCRADLHAVGKLRRWLLPDSPVPVPAAPTLYRLGAALKRLLSSRTRRRATR